MRTLGFRTHVLLAIAAAAGLIFTLDRPWYAAAPSLAPDDPGIGDINGPLNRFAEGAERWVTSADGQSGWDSLGHWGVAIAVMGGIAGLGALGCLLPGLQSLGRDLLRYAAIAALGIVAWKLVDPPGDNGTHELRNGALAAGGAALVLLTAALSVAGAPLRRRVASRPFEAPEIPPPPAYSTSGSAPPPGG